MEIKLALFTLIFLFFVVRAYHHRKAETVGGKIEYREKNLKAIRVMRGVGGIVFLSVLASYFVAPHFVDWAAIPLPDWIRWAGLALGYANLPLLWWIESTLGKNFNTTLHLREGHTLVTAGPYRWVRHPMYTLFVVMLVGSLLLTANWFIGLGGLLALGIVMIVRTPKEEAQLLEKFGDEYREYAERTGRFLPRIS